MVQRRINLLAPNLSACFPLICESLVLLQLGEHWGGFAMYDVQCRASIHPVKTKRNGSIRMQEVTRIGKETLEVDG
jgi:hypothetical protein